MKKENEEIIKEKPQTFVVLQCSLAIFTIHHTSWESVCSLLIRNSL